MDTLDAVRPKTELTGEDLETLLLPRMDVVGAGGPAGRADPIDLEQLAARLLGSLPEHAPQSRHRVHQKWSESPVYEWRLRGDNPPESTPVDLTQPVGLFNTVSSDYLFYDPRRYGINLKWVRDKGKYNSKPWYESVTDGVYGFVSELVHTIYEAANRLVGLVDLVLTFFGIMIPKRVRIRIVILRDADGCAIIADERLPADKLVDEQKQLDDAIGVIRKCFDEQMNTSVRAADGVLVETLPFPAPQNALHVQCGTGAWGDDFQDAGHYFRNNKASGGPGGAPAGYGAPITVFVVDDVEGELGCSLGWLQDYVVVDREGMLRSEKAPEPRPTTPMHEIGHACGLIWHAWPDFLHTGNLMKGDVPRGITLELYQRAIVRNSRHVIRSLSARC
jgi:hypothetical protein